MDSSVQKGSACATLQVWSLGAMTTAEIQPKKVVVTNKDKHTRTKCIVLVTDTYSGNIVV